MKDKKRYKFLFTGGHLTPAMAVLDELMKRGYSNVYWIGRVKTMKGDKSSSAEYRVIKEDLGISFINSLTGKIIRFLDMSSFIDFIINFIKLPIGFIQAFVILIKLKPVMIVSFGGYVAVPIVVMGKILGIKSVTHEQTVTLGKANQIISKFAYKVLISWEETEKYFDKEKVVFTGNPVRKEVKRVVTDNYKINKKLKTIYVTGGNQGSHKINAALVDIIPKLLKRYKVIHQTGINTITGDYEKCLKLEKMMTGKEKGVYIVRGNIFSAEIGEVFAKTDLIISRAGANIITEILTLKKKSILIPIPWSINNEQMKNAQLVERTGLGLILEEKDLKPETFFDSIELIFKKKMRKSKTIEIKSDAAALIVDEIVKLL